MNLLLASKENPVLVPDDTLPGIIFVIVVISLMILFLFWVWYVNYGPGAKNNPNAAKNQS
ncbi:MAG: hypothetical protein ABIO51_02705 [Solirubrobacteraceae bacterium]